MVLVPSKVPSGVLGHGQLTVPLVRGDSQGLRESHEQRAPVFTIAGTWSGISKLFQEEKHENDGQRTLKAVDSRR